MSGITQPIGVLFDMDGVLLDSHNRLIVPSFNTVLAEHELSMADVADPNGQDWRGSSYQDFLTALDDEHGVKIGLTDFVDRTRAEEQRILGEEGIKAEPGLVKFLDDLDSHEVRMGVGSASISERVQETLQHLGISQYFSAIVGDGEVPIGKYKPHPDVYLETARLLGTLPARSVVIEDAAIGVQAGKRAGMKVVGFLMYQEQKESLKEADLVVEQYADLNFSIIRSLVEIE